MVDKSLLQLMNIVESYIGVCPTTLTQYYMNCINVLQ